MENEDLEYPQNRVVRSNSKVRVLRNIPKVAVKQKRKTTKKQNKPKPTSKQKELKTIIEVQTPEIKPADVSNDNLNNLEKTEIPSEDLNTRKKRNFEETETDSADRETSKQKELKTINIEVQTPEIKPVDVSSGNLNELEKTSEFPSEDLNTSKRKFEETETDSTDWEVSSKKIVTTAIIEHLPKLKKKPVLLKKIATRSQSKINNINAIDFDAIEMVLSDSNNCRREVEVIARNAISYNVIDNTHESDSYGSFLHSLVTVNDTAVKSHSPKLTKPKVARKKIICAQRIRRSRKAKQQRCHIDETDSDTVQNSVNKKSVYKCKIRTAICKNSKSANNNIPSDNNNHIAAGVTTNASRSLYSYSTSEDDRDSVPLAFIAKSTPVLISTENAERSINQQHTVIDGVLRGVENNCNESLRDSDIVENIIKDQRKRSSSESFPDLEIEKESSRKYYPPSFSDTESDVDNNITSTVTTSNLARSYSNTNKEQSDVDANSAFKVNSKEIKSSQNGSVVENIEELLNSHIIELSEDTDATIHGLIQPLVDAESPLDSTNTVLSKIKTLLNFNRAIIEHYLKIEKGSVHAFLSKYYGAIVEFENELSNLLQSESD